MKILLYGPSGSGKSTVGKLLAHQLDFTWVDLDMVIEQKCGQTIDSIFSTQGEPYFRELESQLLCEILSSSASMVISLGGGALLNENSQREAQARGKVVLMTASTETLLSRLKTDMNTRPLLEGDARQRLTDLLERRKTHYESFGEPLLTDGLSTEEIVREIQVRLGFFHINGMGSAYEVRIQPGSLHQIGDLLAKMQLRGPSALVCDENVAPLYAEQVMTSMRDSGFDVEIVVIPAGESHKTIHTVTSLWEAFLQAGIERGSFVVALGGGVVGDLTGFAAATFLRGVPWVNLPTTLLSMVDASLGGKTGADLPQGKNLIGAFHAPSLVLTDPQVLSTLPEVELRSGLAETLKSGVIADPDLYTRLNLHGWPREQAAAAALISRAVAVKASVIQSDPYEKGIRQSLNFGHTLGHGIEKASDYQLTHGESVAIGMVLETRLAEKVGLASTGLSKEIASTLAKLGLPVSLPVGFEISSVLTAVNLDKKRSQKQLHFALPEDIGKMRTGVVIENWQNLLEWV